MTDPDRNAVTPLLLGLGWFPEQIGGLNRYFRGLFDALATAGDAPRAVVVGPGAGAPAAVTVVGRHGDRLPARLRRYTEAARNASGGVDVVDAHFALYALLPVVLGSLRRLPLVVHFHGPWSAESRATGGRRLSVAAKHRVERLVYRKAAAIVVLSQAFGRVLVEHYGIEPWRVHVVPPGVDLERFQPGDRREAREQLGLPVDGWIVLAARRLVPRMGLSVLLESWARAEIAEGLLLLAGEGSERRELEALAERLGVKGSVRFLGPVDEAELPLYYRSADVSAVPSLELEGFGLAALESLACGTPVIATAVGGLMEALSRLEADLLVPPGDAGALAARLRTARDSSKPLPAPARCREHAERYSWRKAAARNRDVYAAALHPPHRRPIRAVYLDHCARLSGAELALARLLPSLEGVDAHVVLGEDGPLVPYLLRQGISVEVLPLAPAARDLPRGSVRPRRVSPASIWGAAVYVVRLAIRLRRLRPDLVQTNSLKAAVYGAAAARLARVPLVWHVRDRIAEDYLPAPAVKLVHRLASQPGLILANSEATLSTLGRLGANHSIVPSVVIFDPVAKPSSVAKRSGPLRIGMVGRLTYWKGQHIFIEAFSRAFPDGGERAIVVGSSLFEGPEYRESLQALAERLGMENRVEFTGFREDVGSELAGLDVLVHASVLPEPFGQVIVEGMAAGLPVVASAAGGPLEIIEPERTGLLVPPADVDALAGALRRLAADPALRARLGAAATMRAADFAPEAIAARVVAAYHELLDTR